MSMQLTKVHLVSERQRVRHEQHEMIAFNLFGKDENKKVGIAFLMHLSQVKENSGMCVKLISGLF